jgi:predicted murein hydrolase (TIGR00659 family)
VADLAALAGALPATLVGVLPPTLTDGLATLLTALVAAGGVVGTVVVYALAVRVYRRLGHPLANPVMVAIAAVILMLTLLPIEYATYHSGGRLIALFLGPAVVALGLPLHLQMDDILRHRRAIVAAIVLGALVGVLSGMLPAIALGGSRAVVLTLAPRSVTTPIALGIAERVGGIPPLAATIVIATGVLGAVIGPAILRRAGIRSRTAFGLAMGASAHGAGTARAIEEGAVEGATSGLAIGLMGVATAVLAPIVVALLQWLGLLG